MTHNPTNATYWKKQALEARALAKEAGEVMEGLRVSTITCSRVLGDKILPLGGLHPERVRELIEPILTKLRAAGLLKGGE